MASKKSLRTGRSAPDTSHSGDESTVDLEGRKVKLTRLSKVLYPGSGATKAEVIDYYVRVSRFLLPHLKDRPVTLKRFPDGVKAQAYWDKDAPSFAPDWVRTFPVPRHAGGPDIHYVLINDLPTLAWTANIAALELHPFLHRAPDISVPTSIVFDLDPGAPANVLNCIEVAFLLRDVFDRLGLECFPKVSGSKGLQLYIPLNTPTSYALTQPFARTVAELIAKEHPGLAVSEMPKEKRTGKVFIDWSQNADFKTTVGVYSLRAKTGRPFVSLPITWQEMDSTSESRRIDQLCLEPKAALERVEEIGDLFAPVLELKQTIPAEVLQAIERQAKAKPPKSRDAYEEKRTLARTEPLPRRSTQGGRRRFVVQKHAASHLHYDFRLEMGGVLKSWAVPKGLPYEPGIRRLASETEDHPLEYLNFEGIIPQDQYGGGTVMVWDIGAYEIIEGNYWRGMLHIGMSGTKLKGEWLLTKDRGKGTNAWVLERVGEMPIPISPNDEDRSAITGRSMNQIAGAKDAIWQSNRQGKANEPPAQKPKPSLKYPIDLNSLPAARAEFMEPMQCKLESKLPEGGEWEYEAKLDGYRTLVLKRSDEVRLLSRRNNVLTNEFPNVAAALENLEDDTVIDGEIVALDEQGKSSFSQLQNRRVNRGAIRFYAFDILVFRGKDLMRETLRSRRELLTTVLAHASHPVHLSVSLKASPQALIAAARQHNLEGIIAKRLDSHYEPGKRSGAWVKVKINPDQELVIGGYIPSGKRHFDALLVGYYQGSRLIFSGKVRNGFTVAGSKERVFARLKGLGTTKCPFDNLPEPANARRGMALTAEAMKLCCWLKPKLVAQVGIREWTADGHLRHSTFLGLREDKDAREVVREQELNVDSGAVDSPEIKRWS